MDNQTESRELSNEGYPKDLFTLDELKQGAVFLHVIGLFYMFFALAIVCDEFFVPALEVVADKLQLSADVAGATFMAAGGSAPELFTNIAGVLIINSPVGIGTVVGSAVFNILFVIGACSIFSKTLLVLTWWPLFRDVVFYSISLLMLIFFFNDGNVSWWESILLIACYVSYGVFMKYNTLLERKFNSSPKKASCRVSLALVAHLHASNIIDQLEDNAKEKDVDNDNKSIESSSSSDEDEGDLDDQPSSLPSQDQQSKQYSPGATKSTSGQMLWKHVKEQKSATKLHSPPPINSDIEQNHNCLVSTSNQDNESTEVDPAPDHQDHVESSENPKTDIYPKSTISNVEEANTPLDISWPDGKLNQIKYIILAPILLPLWLTLPDVRRPESVKFFPISFFGSIIWIGMFSYLMVWWAIVIGQVAGINDTIMGLTFLAAGTSVPDLMTSVIVARKGFGDMAVSSSVGSNLFDITIGLPVPWLLFSLYQQKDYVVNSEGLFCSVMMLFLMLIMVVLSIAGFGWKMHKGLGLVMIILYIIFLIFAIMLEQKHLECPKIAF